MEKVTDILTFSAMSVIMTIVSVVVLWLVHTSNNRNHYRGNFLGHLSDIVRSTAGCEAWHY